MKTSWKEKKAELDDSLALGVNWGEKKEFIKAFGEPEAQWCSYRHVLGEERPAGSNMVRVMRDLSGDANGDGLSLARC